MKVSLFNDIVLAELEGEVDGREADRLLALVGDLLDGERSVILSFKEADHINYRLPARLQHEVREGARLEGAVKLAHVSRYQQAIFDAMGAGDLFEQYRSVDEALLSCCPRATLH